MVSFCRGYKREGFQGGMVTFVSPAVRLVVWVVRWLVGILGCIVAIVLCGSCGGGRWDCSLWGSV